MNSSRGSGEAVVRVWRFPARLGAVVGALIGSATVAVAPASAAPGFTATLAGVPDRFTAGGGAATVSAVVSRDANSFPRGGGNDCLRVRWSLRLGVAGLRLDQVRVDRIEETGSFPVDVRAEGNGNVRITDARFDPGALCRNRTVTARYRISFAGDATQGRVSLSAEAFDANQRLLAAASSTREVAGRRARVAASPSRTAPRPTPPPTKPAAVIEEPATVEPDGPLDGPEYEDTDAAGAGSDAARTARTSAGGGFGLTQVGFLVGGLLLFFGVGLLLRLRRLTRTAPEGPSTPTDRWPGRRQPDSGPSTDRWPGARPSSGGPSADRWGGSRRSAADDATMTMDPRDRSVDADVTVSAEPSWGRSGSERPPVPPPPPDLWARRPRPRSRRRRPAVR